MPPSPSAADADPEARLPELVAGFDRSSTPDLVPYPTACSAQAWATGVILMAVRTLLGMPVGERDAAWRWLTLDPPERAEWTVADLASAGER